MFLLSVLSRLQLFFAASHRKTQPRWPRPAELESNAFICTVSLRMAVHVGAMVSIWANECVWDATAESRAAKGWVDQRFADWLAGSWPFPALFATVTAGWKKEPKAPAARPLTCTSTPLTAPACSRPLTLFHGPFPSASSQKLSLSRLEPDAAERSPTTVLYRPR